MDSKSKQIFKFFQLKCTQGSFCSNLRFIHFLVFKENGATTTASLGTGTRQRVQSYRLNALKQLRNMKAPRPGFEPGIPKEPALKAGAIPSYAIVAK